MKGNRFAPLVGSDDLSTQLRLTEVESVQFST